MFYFVNFGILLAYSLIFKFFIHNNKKLYFIVSAIHIGGIMAFRSCFTGTDTYQYYNVYKYLINYKGTFPELIKMYDKFPGWAVLFKVVSLFSGSNPNMYMFVAGYFTVIITWIAIAVLEVDQMQAVILYYLLFALQAMNVARQNMALCLIFLSVALFLKGKKILSILIIPLAMSIHISAVIGILIIMVLTINWTRKRVLYIIAASVGAFLLVNILFNFFANSFSGYSSYILGTLKASGRNVVMQIMYILTFFYAIWIQTKYNMEIKKEQMLLKLCVLMWGEIILGIYFSSEIFIVRENLYLQIFIIILTPLVIEYFNKYRKFYGLIVYSMALFYFSYRVIGNYGGIIPYQTYLFDK